MLLAALSVTDEILNLPMTVQVGNVSLYIHLRAARIVFGYIDLISDHLSGLLIFQYLACEKHTLFDASIHGLSESPSTLGHLCLVLGSVTETKGIDECRFDRTRHGF